MAGQTNSANVAPTASPPVDPILELAWQCFALYLARIFLEREDQ